MGAESQVKVVIEGESQSAVQAAQATVRELEELKRQAIASGVSTAGLDAELAKAQQTLSRLAKQELPQAAEGISYFNVHGREMTRLIMQLDRIAPGAGEVLRLAFRPETLGIAATVLAITEVVKWIKEAQKAADELRDKEAQIQSAVWDAQIAGANASAEAAQEYADKLDAIATKTDAAKNSEELKLAVLKAEEQAQLKILEAQEKAELAAAKGDKVKEAEIRERYGQRKSAAETAAEQAQIKAEQDFLTEQTRKRDEARAASDAAEAAAAAARGDTSPSAAAAARLKDLQGDKTTGQDALLKNLLKLTGASDLAGAQEAMDKLAIQAAAGGPSFVPGQGGTMVETYAGAQRLLLAKTQDAAAALDKNQNAIGEENAIIENHNLIVKKLNETAKTALDKYGNLSTAVDALSQKIKVQTAVSGIDQAGRAAADLADPNRKGGLGSIVSDYAGAAAGHPLIASQQAEIVAYKQILDAAHENSKAILQTILTLLGMHVDQAQIVKIVQDQINAQANHTLSH